MSQVKAPTVKEELKSMILEGLKRSYTSTSIKDGIQTGNHYQSITLGDEQTSGFRSDRKEFLDRIDFRGKRVLDLGSNLGEMSRAARRRGAALVDGFEYDAFFVEMAQLINAYNDTTRVSFYARDITDPKIYTEHYDIVLAFSVYTYIQPVLDALARITDQALVIETHKLHDNLERDYIGPVTKHLPIHEVLGSSDWGKSLSTEESRSVVVFSRGKRALDLALGRQQEPPRQIRIDVQQTALQALFFETFGTRTGAELLADARNATIALPAAADDPDLAKLVYSGRLYWQIFLKGYCQYLEEGVLGRGNIYFDYITEYYAPRGHDPALCRALSDPLYAQQRVAARFRDLDQFRKAPLSFTPSPIRIFYTGDPGKDRLVLHQAERDDKVQASAVDGWHRLFAARIFGAQTVPAELVAST